MLRVAVPNKGSLSQTATHILEEAGYRMRRDSKDLTSWDEQNDVEFFFLRPKDIAIYVAKGHLDLGITGRDLAADSAANGVDELLALGFGASTFRYAAPDNEEWNLNKIEGKRIATSYPHLVSADLAKRGIQADVIRLDGAVEISIRLGVADIIADVVSTGRTLRQQGLSPFDVICTSEAIIVGRHNQPVTDEHQILLRRIEGILHAKNYLMIDYNCPKSLLAEATKLTPGLSAPTVSPLADDDWVAVRAMAPRKDANQLMDRLSALGAEAILATDIRIARLTR